MKNSTAPVQRVSLKDTFFVEGGATVRLYRAELVKLGVESLILGV